MPGLVIHPALTDQLFYNEAASGEPKCQCVFCPHRAAQYACTLLGYTLQKGGAGAELCKTVSQLEAHMSLTRKCE